MKRRTALATAASLVAAPRALAAEDPDKGATEFLPPPVVFSQAFWAVCDFALRSGTLRGADVRTFERVRERADEHATAIENVLEGFGSVPPKRPAKPTEVPLPGFHEVSGRDGYVDFAAAAALGSIGAWYVALQQLRQPELLRLGAAAMAADAQSLVVLRGLQGKDPLQPAFETGRPE